MQTETLIVGGGLAGLALADHLHRAGKPFHLIEAQDRLGGRILSEYHNGSAFDLGPAWFWPGQPRMAALTRRFALQVFEQFATGDMMFQEQSGAVHRTQNQAAMQGSYRVDGGMAALVDALATELPSQALQKGAKVTTLQRTNTGVDALLSNGGRINAARVILALPPRVADATLQFNPPLTDETTTAMRGIPTWMAGQAKIVAVYDKPYWRDAGLSGDAMSYRGPMVEIHDASPFAGPPYALFGFVGVPSHVRVSQRDEVLSLAIDQLAALFGPELAHPLGTYFQDWATLPEIATTADHAPLGAHPRYGRPTALGNLWDGHLHMASTEMGPGFGGYLEGALEAAEDMAHLLAR